MNSVNIEIERTKKRLFIQRLENELNDEDADKDDEHYKKIKQIYEKLTSKTTNLNLDQLLTKAGDDVYNKKWNRLPDYHKLQKIKEYLDEKYKNTTERKEIEETLKKRIADGTLNSVKFVDYDNVECKIKKITLSKKDHLIY